MRYYVGNVFVGEDFYHHGVKGQKHGVRRYQNADGSLTMEGYRHYGRNLPGKKKRALNFLKTKKKSAGKIGDKVKNVTRPWKEMSEEELKKRTERIKIENEYLDAKKKQKQLRKRERAPKQRGEHVVLNILKDFGLAAMNNAMNNAAKMGMKKLENLANERISDNTARINATSNENIARIYADRGLVGPSSGSGNGNRRRRNNP